MKKLDGINVNIAQDFPIKINRVRKKTFCYEVRLLLNQLVGKEVAVFGPLTTKKLRDKFTWRIRSAYQNHPVVRVSLRSVIGDDGKYYIYARLVTRGVVVERKGKWKSSRNI